jgi:hypothetical protein
LTPQQNHSTQQTALLALSLVPSRLELLLRRTGLVAPVKHLDGLPPCFQPVSDTIILLDTAGLPPAQLAQLLVRLSPTLPPRRHGPHPRLVGLVDVGAKSAPALLACAGAACLQQREVAQVAGLLDHLMPIVAPRPGLSTAFLEVYAALSGASSIGEAAAHCGRSRSSFYQVLSTGRAALGLPSRRGSRPGDLAAEILDALERSVLPAEH